MPNKIAGKYENTLPIQDIFGNLPPGTYTFVIDVNCGEYTERIDITIRGDHRMEFYPLPHRVGNKFEIVKQADPCTDT